MVKDSHIIRRTVYDHEANRHTELSVEIPEIFSNEEIEKIQKAVSKPYPKILIKYVGIKEFVLKRALLKLQIEVHCKSEFDEI